GLRQAEMSLQDEWRLVASQPDRTGKLLPEAIRPLTASQGDHAQQSARLSELATQVVFGRHESRILGQSLCLVQKALVPADQTAREERLKTTWVASSERRAL